MTTARLVACATLLAVFAGCQTAPYQPYARQVKAKPGVSGVIALNEKHQEEDRAKALSMIAMNCGSKPYTIVEEGEVVTGQETVSNAQESYNRGQRGTQVGQLWGVPLMSGAKDPSTNTSSTATTKALKEWQLSYECAGTATADAAPAAAAPAAPAKKAKK